MAELMLWAVGVAVVALVVRAMWRGAQRESVRQAALERLRERIS